MSSPSIGWRIEQLGREIEETLRYRRLELLKLIGGFVLITVSAYFASQMAGYGWEAGQSLTRGLAYGTMQLIGVSPDVFFAFPVGIFFGLIAAMVADRFKRFQGILLLGGTIVTAGVLSNRDLLFGAIDWSDPVVIATVLSGAVLSLVVSVGWEIYTGFPPYTYSLAVRGVFVGVLLVAVLGFLEALLSYRSPVVATGAGYTLQRPVFLGFDFGATVLAGGPFAAVFVGITYWFLSYESETDAILLGPSRSGKTWLMGGLHYTLSREARRGSVPTQPSEDMNEVFSAFEHRNFTADALGPNDENVVRALKFNYVSGVIFPQKVTLRALDYAGEHLTEITCDTEDYEPNADTIESVFETAKRGEMRESDIRQLLSDFVYWADRIGLLVPMDEFTGDASDVRVAPSRYAAKYASLVDRFRGEKDFLLIATKADMVEDEFVREKNRTPDADPVEFSRFIEAEYVNGDATGFGQLFEYPTIRESIVYPTYYKVKRQAAGRIHPDIDDPAHPPVRGAHRLLERLGR
ncbi:MAG: hypothetical protein ABEJ60_04685 [Halodesulfurarchaeum sp.]